MNKKPSAVYSNPLIERYASSEMSYVFSSDFKFSTWRKLWVALAESEKELGLAITQEQIDELKAHVNDIDYDAARAYEKKTRHDVMAHILAYGDKCPLAKPIIHLGSTSAFVTDNTDIIQLKESCRIILKRLSALITVLRNFAVANKDLATLGFTHFQAAQLTTVGKRASLWLLELSMDFKQINLFHDDLSLLGAKGATGTQASYLNLFNGDHAKVKQLDQSIAARMNFAAVLPVAGQTYTRKIDARACEVLSGLCQSLHKMANDIRLLQHLKEIEEPFEQNQIGSSAMPYKRNPMRSERLTSLCRFVLSLAISPAMTASEQWFERTLDDSANKRLSIPQAFLAADACLIIGHNICDGLVIYPRVIANHINAELPFMATENILMQAVKRGGDRQELHEKIRQHAQTAGNRVKLEGLPNDLIERIAADSAFKLSKNDIESIMNVREFIGCAPEQVTDFIADHIDPLLAQATRAFGTAQTVELAV